MFSDYTHHEGLAMMSGNSRLPRSDADDTAKARPVVFGELLFDSFPDGSRVLGGAPFNVAWHLAGLGFDPLLITRIGDDAAGHDALAAMRQWGLDCSGVQVDTQRATGEVEVRLDGGDPEFLIAPHQAWDEIDFEHAQSVVDGSQSSLFYHGTLAARHEASASTLRALRAQHPVCFVDLNLRAPWYSAQTIADAVAEADWLKLNQQELDLLEPAIGAEDAFAAAMQVRKHHDLDGVILTLGADGAIIAADEIVHARPSVREAGREGDPVGAGDAFAAACIAGVVRGLPLTAMLDSAMALAGEVCRVRGALLRDRTSYRRRSSY